MPPVRNSRAPIPAVREPPSRISRVLLVGFMGSGKSAVGRRLARLLGWRFVDMDVEVQAEVARPIPEIFRTEGEAWFRQVEDRVAQRLLQSDEAVIASGGGWPCSAGRLEALPAGTLAVWLRVSPEEAVARVRSSPTPRPLLEVEDPLARARELLAEREAYYGRAHWTVQTDGRRPGAVARTLRGRLGRDLGAR